jgi:PKHD-type hydroxylase
MNTNPKVLNFITYPYVFWDNWLSLDDLTAINEYCSKQVMTTGGTVDLEGNSVPNDVRDSKVSMIHSTPDNKWLFDKLLNIASIVNNRFYNYDLLGFDYVQYTEYDGKGTKYDTHIDMILGEGLSHDLLIPRKLSFSLILSDPSEYEGGDLELYNGVSKMVPEQIAGRIIAFPSFIPHAVTPLITGKRKSLVFWAVGPKFK